MKIEKIEFNGFKSFAEKTTFNLHSGITCIVGPNGCGKSNVVDAFRWVLGEQSAKTLRGEKMEEVIFNGSATRKPKGMAEVTLAISGLGGGNGNGDGDDRVFTVTRRLYRSGESEYLINRNPCRLKDIKDLFLDTGLEVKSYSIIEQGRIGDILNSKPIERRFLIEEVAGVMKYKVRKAEAQSKLESSRQNLQRITDVVSEVKKQINTLDRLAKKAERYKALADELKEIDLKLSRRDYLTYKRQLSEASEKHDRAKEEETALRASLSAVEADYQTRRLELLQKEKELGGLHEEFQGLERAVADFQKQIAVLTTESQGARDSAVRIRAQIDDIGRRAEALHSRLGVLESDRETLTSQLEAFSLSLSEKRDFIAGIEQEIGTFESALEDKRGDIFRAAEAVSAAHNDLALLRSALDSMSKRESRHSQELEETAAAMEQVETAIRDGDGAILRMNNDLGMLRAQKETLQKTAAHCRETIETLRGAIATLKEEVASDNSRVESLQEIVSETLSPEILSESEKFHVMGTLSDVLTVDPRYEKAIESILGDTLSGYILSSLPDIESAVAFIRERTLSRTALLAPGELPADANAALPAEETIIGRAVDFVQADQTYLPVVRRLLAKVFVVRDLGSALKLREAHPDIVFVTPSGEVLDGTDTVFAGEGRGILARKREIREIRERISEKLSAVHRKDAELSEAVDAAARAETEALAVGERIVRMENDLSLQRLELQTLAQEKERLQRKRANIRIEMEQAQQEKSDLTRKVGDLQGSLEMLAARRSELEQSLQAQQKTLAEKRSFYEAHRSELTDMKLEMTSCREKIEAASREVESVRASLDEGGQRTEALARELEETTSGEAEKVSSILAIEETVKVRVLTIDEKRAVINSLRAVIEDMTAALAGTEHELRDLRGRIDESAAAVSSLEVAKTEFRLKMENAFNTTVQMYGVNIDLHETSEPTEDELQKLPALRERIQSIGPVNLGTIEEYEELKNRFTFLSTQQDDLTKSIEELEEAIRKINYTTRKRLRDAFTELNAKFGEVFGHLFRGGRAELVLTDEQNILESGIDIIAQPPGKRLQSISLLSGGEKALTAIALVFAGFLIKPAPICLLDEADAPLDDSNTDRFAALVRELAGSTQFIVITHNRMTMENADYIYGITMEEPGTSKVISMQLAEA